MLARGRLSSRCCPLTTPARSLARYSVALATSSSVLTASRADGHLGCQSVTTDDSVAALIHRFYDEAWNRWNDAAVDELLSDEFVFRGSLGDETVGRNGFRAYRDKVRAAFPDFRNEVRELLVDRHRAAVRLRCSGRHTGELFGIEPTRRVVRYEAAAFFHEQDGRLSEAWVLADLEGVRAQLKTETVKQD